MGQNDAVDFVQQLLKKDPQAGSRLPAPKTKGASSAVQVSPKKDDNKLMPNPDDSYSRKTIETMFELHQERFSRQMDAALAEMKGIRNDIQSANTQIASDIANVEARISGQINRNEAVLATHMAWVIGVVGALTVTIVGGLILSYLQKPLNTAPPKIEARPAITQPVEK